MADPGVNEASLWASWGVDSEDKPHTGAEHTPLWFLTTWHSGVSIDLSYMGTVVCPLAVTLFRMCLELYEVCGVPRERERVFYSG